eukprot:Selendium_serpulae@DN2803_c0_g1_i1.p1
MPLVKNESVKTEDSSTLELSQACGKTEQLASDQLLGVKNDEPPDSAAKISELTEHDSAQWRKSQDVPAASDRSLMILEPHTKISAFEGLKPFKAVLNETESPMMLAGLFDVWEGHEGNVAEVSQYTYTILTMDSSNTIVEDIHERQPVFLTPDTARLWLDCKRPFSAIKKEVMSGSVWAATQELYAYEVPSSVGSIKFDTIDCVSNLKDFKAKQFQQGLGRFFKRKADTEKDDKDHKIKKTS